MGNSFKVIQDVSQSSVESKWSLLLLEMSTKLPNDLI